MLICDLDTGYSHLIDDSDSYKLSYYLDIWMNWSFRLDEQQQGKKVIRNKIFVCIKGKMCYFLLLFLPG